jgi:hypothetical protein
MAANAYAPHYKMHGHAKDVFTLLSGSVNVTKAHRMFSASTKHEPLTKGWYGTTGAWPGLVLGSNESAVYCTAHIVRCTLLSKVAIQQTVGSCYFTHGSLVTVAIWRIICS